MSIGELSLESSLSLSVTWTIPDFFRLLGRFGCSLRSPDFTFADIRCRLLLFHRGCLDSGGIGIELLNLADTDHGRAVLYEVHLKSRNVEIDFRPQQNNQNVFRCLRRLLDRERDQCAPDDNLTAVCSVRLREPNNAGSPKSGDARTRDIPGYRVAGNLSSESFPFLYVSWKIPGFSQLARTSTRTLESPEFPFSDRRYRLRLDTREYTVLMLNSTDNVTGRCASCKAELKSKTGEEIDLECSGTSTTPEFRIDPRALFDMDPVRFPDGHLTVFCWLRSREANSAGSPESGGAETPNEEENKERLAGISKLSSDLNQLLQNIQDSDACLVVSGKEFRAHQIILRARSKVFDAMFGHETAERGSGRVVIDDLDPDSFGDFLEYLYTGTVGAGLSEDNAFGLYEAADKYDVPALKKECVSHIGRHLSMDSFYDVLAVALRHSDEELLSAAVPFFKENMARIVLTPEWIKLAIDNGACANKLMTKASDLPVQSDPVPLSIHRTQTRVNGAPGQGVLREALLYHKHLNY